MRLSITSHLKRIELSVTEHNVMRALNLDVFTRLMQRLQLTWESMSVDV